MGMYTEVLLRADLIKDLPEEVELILGILTGTVEFTHQSLPAHPLFETSRWQYMGSSGSYYFPEGGRSKLIRDEYRRGIFLHGNLKNYESEIEELFDWIDPYLEHTKGDFLGYSMYEEGNKPTLHFKLSDSYNP